MTLPGREGDRERAAALEEQIKILAETASAALDKVTELEQAVSRLNVEKEQLSNDKTLLSAELETSTAQTQSLQSLQKLWQSSQQEVSTPSSPHSQPDSNSSRNSTVESEATDLSDFEDDDKLHPDMIKRPTSSVSEGGMTSNLIGERLKNANKEELKLEVIRLQRLLHRQELRAEDLFRMEKLEAALCAVSKARATLRRSGERV